jgi:hypothetical protein
LLLFIAIVMFAPRRDGDDPDAEPAGLEVRPAGTAFVRPYGGRSRPHCSRSRASSACGDDLPRERNGAARELALAGIVIAPFSATPWLACSVLLAAGAALCVIAWRRVRAVWDEVQREIEAKLGTASLA